MNVSRFSLSAFCRNENGVVCTCCVTCLMMRDGIFLAERLAEQRLGVFQAAFGEVGVGQGQVVELAEDVVASVDADLADARRSRG